MRRLLTGYAVSHNRRHGRTGHLFQNRYKSILCDEEPYLLELVRYVHLNPVRAGLVKDMQALDAYRYGGHSAIVAIYAENDRQPSDPAPFALVLGSIGYRSPDSCGIWGENGILPGD
jgi:hypothetical protein